MSNPTLHHSAITSPIPIAVPATPPTTQTAIDLKVLHLVNGEHFSGAERVQSHLGRCLPSLGVAADFASVKPGKFARMIDEQGGKWGNSHEVPMTSRFDLRVAARLCEITQQNQYDLLHAHTPRTAMLASFVSKRTGLPWVYHVHSPTAHDSTRKWINRVNALVEKQSLRGCSHIIAVSESLRCRCVADGIDEEKISVVHNGVPSANVHRSSLPVPSRPWVLGMVALMRPRKGLEIVLEAMAKLVARKCDVTLKCIGAFESEAYESEIHAKIKELELGSFVQLVGFTNDVPSELVQLDAMVLPSLFGEGLPMVVLEAMASGVPVIATRVEGTPEAITDGAEGLLARPGDPESLADTIDAMINGEHDWQQMSSLAVARHADDFSDNAMARGTANVYRRMVSSSMNR